MNNMLRSARTAVVVLVFLTLTTPFESLPEAEACPNCKQMIADGDTPTSSSNLSEPGGADLSSGYSYSVLFMMSVPYALTAGLGAGLWTYRRRIQHDRT